MSLYGDRGNIQTLSFRAKKRSISVNIQYCNPQESIQENPHIIMIGGGQDKDQNLILQDLLPRRHQLLELISQGSLMLGICGGYQLLGKYYQIDNNQIPCLNLVDFHTISSPTNESRIIGNLIINNSIWGDLWGFENHGGRTYLGDGISPLGTVIQGQGNNGTDKTEGIYHPYNKGLILGTYFHTFLPKNPQIADFLIQKALNLPELSPLDDTLENINKKVGLSLSY